MQVPESAEINAAPRRIGLIAARYRRHAVRRPQRPAEPGDADPQRRTRIAGLAVIPQRANEQVPAARRPSEQQEYAQQCSRRAVEWHHQAFVGHGF